MNVIQTNRLILRKLREDDAAFMLELLNEPSFIQNIGDRGVRTIDRARAYLLRGPIASYAQFGFGLYLAELKESGEALGICGLVKRDTLEVPDIGFAFLERHWGNGYAYEAATAVMNYARQGLGLTRIVAITAPENSGSIRILEKIGLRPGGMVRLPGHATHSQLFTGP